MVCWVQKVFASADTETTGVDIEEDRILTAAVLTIDPPNGTWTSLHWVIDPGVDVPADAARIHGYDTARIRREGRKDVAVAIGEIADALMNLVHLNVPIVIYNAPFDLSLVDRETRRYGLRPLADRLAGAVEAPVIVDPYCLDKRLDKWRKGSRKLTAMSEHYGVPVGEDAHGCVPDALASARVAWQLCVKYPQLARMSVTDLHEFQVRAKADWAADFIEHLKKQGKPADDVRGDWPLVPCVARQEALTP